MNRVRLKLNTPLFNALPSCSLIELAHRNRENTQSFTHPPTYRHFLNYKLSYVYQVKNKNHNRIENGTRGMKIFRTYITILFLLALNLSFTNKSIAEISPETGLEVQPKTQQNNDKANGDYVRKRFLQLMKKPFDTNDQKNLKLKILIIGDSHAQDFLNSIVENKLLTLSQIRTRYIPTRCQIYLGDKTNSKIHENDAALCGKSDNLEQAKEQIAEADIIIFSALWRMWAVKELPNTIVNLGLSSDQKLFVIGRRSFLKVSNGVILGLPKSELHDLRNEVDIHQLDINTLMSKTLDGRVFIDVQKLVCGSSPTCPVFTDRLKMISFDGGHLSQDGARYLGELLFRKSQLSTLIKPN